MAGRSPTRAIEQCIVAYVVLCYTYLRDSRQHACGTDNDEKQSAVPRPKSSRWTQDFGLFSEQTGIKKLNQLLDSLSRLECNYEIVTPTFVHLLRKAGLKRRAQMPQAVHCISIFVAASSDVAQEREALKEIVTKLDDRYDRWASICRSSTGSPM